MPTDVTLESGTEVQELEGMFDDGADFIGSPTQTGKEGQQAQTGKDGETTQVEVVDDPDLELDLDPNAVVDPLDPNEVVDPELKLVIDGTEVTKKQSELIAEAQKYAGAEKRFQEAAEIRKTAEAQIQKTTEREQQLGKVLEFYIREANQLMQARQPDWQALINEDPKKYLTIRSAWEAEQGKLQQAANTKAELERQNAEQQSVSTKTRVEQERVKLLEAIPEWKDPVKAAEGAKAVGDYLKGTGIPEQMLAQIDHHQVLLVARKAMLYDQAMAKQKAARANPAAAQQQNGQRQTTRVVRPGAAQGVQTQARRTEASRANAEKSFAANPSVDTLANWFE